MDRIKVILVDDDKANLKVLEFHLKENCPDVDVVACCSEPDEAINKITTLEPDAVFLDVDMPQLSGFDLLTAVSPAEFAVIFVTGHDKYAAEAFKVNATDYLVKPVTKSALVSAIGKVRDRKGFLSVEMLTRLVAQATTPTRTFGALRKIAVATAESLEFITISDIVYCESESNYTTIHRSDTRPLIISKTLKIMEEMLPKEEFYRIHNSFLINMNHVDRYAREDGGYLVMSNNAQISISRSKKDDFLSRFKQI